MASEPVTTRTQDAEGRARAGAELRHEVVEAHEAQDIMVTVRGEVPAGAYYGGRHEAASPPRRTEGNDT
jgi:hypothetical protein